MGEERVRSGTALIDYLLDGGYEKDVLTCIYGPPGAGKTNLALLCCANSDSLKGKKIIYIDTEGNFSVSRFKQVCSEAEEVLKRVIVLAPVSFDEQRLAFEKLRKIVTDKIGLIVLDSVAMLYRLELGKSKDVYNVNRELGLQLSYLTEIARKKGIPVIVTNQVYADIDGQPGATRMVGGDIIKYSSKCLIEIVRHEDGSRSAILRKHRSLPDRKEVRFRIVEEGIAEASGFVPSP